MSIKDQRLHNAWNSIQLGLLLFPLLPLVGAIALLWAQFVIWRRQYRTIFRRRLNWVLIILSGWLVVMSLFAYYRRDAWLGLFNFVPFFGLFVTFSVLLQTPAQLRRLAQILVFTSVPITIAGFGQLYWGWATPKAWHDILVTLGCAIVPQGNPPGRMTSIFMYTNVLGAYLAIAFILSVGLWIESFLEKSKVKSQKSKLFYPSPLTPRSSPLTTQILLGAIVLGNLAALILTNSRNAWAIAAIAAIAFAVYQGWHWLLVGVSAIATAIVGAAFSPPPLQQWLRLIVPAYFWQRLTDQLYVRPEATLRTTQWRFAWNLTLQRPWTGWGLRNFQPLYMAQTQTWMGHPHNLFLMLTAEIGLPATIVFCAWIGWILFQSIQFLAKRSPDSCTGGFDRKIIPSLTDIPNKPAPTDSRFPHHSDRLIVFTYLVAVCAYLLFNTTDVTIFDARLNTLFWILLAAIAGVTQRHQERILP
ncbi:polymerase [Chroococcidiopsis sp. CCALA 051]|uniref:O-antigen ligase family protein n=1 Tax=Chroococcidiopsis sp. CCALA 051 TaxID=869949 RepID=UPI000D0D0BB3|nr:O-antigen ligase family protein [Chroococcidiopsis sp. CCALA 051]PSM47591.1 polymerase [Chroococcidiopsis sp. CCALA 051]